MKNILSMRSFVLNESNQEKGGPLWVVFPAKESIEQEFLVTTNESDAHDFFEDQNQEHLLYCFSRYMGGDDFTEDGNSDWTESETFKDFCKNHYDPTSGEPAQIFGPFYVSEPKHQDIVDAIIEESRAGNGLQPMKVLLEHGLDPLRAFDSIQQAIEIFKNAGLPLEPEKLPEGDLKWAVKRNVKSDRLFGV